MPYFSFTQFNIGPFVFQTWGALLGLAFLAGYWIFLRAAKREGIKEKKIFWLVFWVFVGAVLGSRLLYLLQFSPFIFSDFFQLRDGGFASHGGLLGGMLAGWIYARKNKLSFWQLADWAAPAVALGIFFGRIGCSLVNGHPGAFTNLPWAIEWPNGILRHPVAEYLAINALIMFFVLRRSYIFTSRSDLFNTTFLRKKIISKRSDLGASVIKKLNRFIVFLVWYNVARFFLDFTRATDAGFAEPRLWGLFVSQWMALCILAGVGGFLVWKSRIQKA